jgi:hypothetical protein
LSLVVEENGPKFIALFSPSPIGPEPFPHALVSKIGCAS